MGKLLDKSVSDKWTEIFICLSY